MYKYDYLIVGCGIFGIVFAQRMSKSGKKVLIIEKREHIGGNCYTENIEGISVHKYGPHIFHTDNSIVWEYINHFACFNSFVNRPKVLYKSQLYSFPINLMTLYQLYGTKTPLEAKRKLKEVIIHKKSPKNLEEWIMSQVGKDIYEIFIKGYTRKQWNRDPKDLPISLIKRVPIRLDFNDNYFNDKYQGIPVGGYTKMFEKMLKGIETILNTNYFEQKSYWDSITKTIVYTGKIDEYFDYKYGHLEYRGLRFETEVKKGDYQGNAIINYTEEDVPYTRIIEHKHFEFGNQPRTVVTREIPTECGVDDIPYYPINTKRNVDLYKRYKQEAEKEINLLLGGRLATYKYLDMDDVILSALQTVKVLL
jgi:UDP-galactopyranose mutase